MCYCSRSTSVRSCQESFHRKWPDTHGEDKFVIMLGSLHIETGLWNLCGDLLKGSGWTTALSDSDVASSGTADSFLRICHLARTRHALH